MLDRRMSFQRQSKLEVPGKVILAKIRRLEQLLQQDHLCALRRSLAHEFLGARNIGVAIPTAGHLRGRYGYPAHITSMLPDLSDFNWRTGSPRPGKSGASAPRNSAASWR